MFYLGNDQHARQITICLRDESGDVVEKRQVSTEPDKIRAFLADLRERTAVDGGYMAILEVCGFNDWYVDLLKERGCREVILVQPEDSSSRKTDRRDAAKLSEQLWMNRLRIVTPVLRHDPWMRAFFLRVKKRRGPKIARVAVMRRLCTVIYRMLEQNEPYVTGGPTEVVKRRERAALSQSTLTQREEARIMALAASG